MDLRTEEQWHIKGHYALPVLTVGCVTAARYFTPAHYVGAVIIHNDMKECIVMSEQTLITICVYAIIPCVLVTP